MATRKAPAESKAPVAPKVEEVVAPAVDEQASQINALEGSNAELGLLLKQSQDRIDALEAKGEAPVPQATTYEDPYDMHGALKLKNDGRIPPTKDFPEGRRLGWKNAANRDRFRGWRGWVPVQYGDDIAGPDGVFLSKYLYEAPSRVAGNEHVDSYVRRGDAVLSYLDGRIAIARERNSKEKSEGRVRSLNASESFGQGVSTFGGVDTSEEGQKTAIVGTPLGESNPTSHIKG